MEEKKVISKTNIRNLTPMIIIKGGRCIYHFRDIAFSYIGKYNPDSFKDLLQLFDKYEDLSLSLENLIDVYEEIELILNNFNLEILGDDFYDLKYGIEELKETLFKNRKK